MGSPGGREGTGGPNAGDGLRADGGPGVAPLTPGGRLGGAPDAVPGRDAGGLKERYGKIFNIMSKTNVIYLILAQHIFK